MTSIETRGRAADALPGLQGKHVVPGLTHVAFGGDYNPEQWPREIWAEDIRLMREAGVNLATVGVFSWALLEPREGEFEWGWLDEVIGMLHDAGIGVDLATPTASPPAWFWSRYPQARPVTRDGVSLGFGSRGMASPSSPEYAAAVTRFVTALAERYGSHPAIRLWHVHNEYGAPVSESYDESSVTAFRGWLEKRYGSIDALNAAWGTTFWGQRYGNWDEIDAPRKAASVVNPSQRIDFARFTNDALLACFIRERDIIRRHSPGIPITTNFMATSCPSVNYWTWAREIDVISNDHYLTGEREDAHILLAMAADMTRSLAGGRPWLLMEHSTSAVNWQDRNIAKRPGELARNSFSHWARGADGILFFQWRASRFGAEKFHSAMVPHSGADSRVFREVSALGANLGQLDDAIGTEVKPKAAILWDWESMWALGMEWRPSIDLDFHRQVEGYYTWLWNEGVTIDFAHPSADLSAYDLVVAPSLYVTTAESSENLREFVERGGTLVTGYFSGVVDGNDQIAPGNIPGALRDVLGLHVNEFLPLRRMESVRLRNDVVGSFWAEDISPTSAETVLEFVDGPAAGGPAVTRNRLGDGHAWYVATDLTADSLATTLEQALRESGVERAGGRGLEVIVRESPEETFTTFINHTMLDVTVEAEGLELIAGDSVVGELSVPAGAVRIIRRPAAER